MSYNEEDYLLLSGIQHFAFCRRQWALIHIEQQWDDNYRTTAGEIFHKNAHDENFVEKRGSIITVRGLRVSSSLLGMSGQCDVVEFHECIDGIALHGYEGKWSVIPIEYKRGKPKDGNEDEVQLCAQAMCLEEMLLTKIPFGYLYYGKEKRRVEVAFSLEMRELVIKITNEMHQLFKKGYTPKVKTSSKCKACSLNELCLPKLMSRTSISQYIDERMRED